MKKKNGFTLVELLGTIAVLAVVLAITGYVIFGVINRTKQKTYDVVINNIKDSAKTYIKENADKLFFVANSNGVSKEHQCVTVQHLIDSGYFDNSVLKSNVTVKEKVEGDDVVYLERDIKTKNVDVVLYPKTDGLENSMTDDCNKAMSAEATIRLSVEDADVWKPEKKLIIEYIIGGQLRDISKIYEYDKENGIKDRSNVNENAIDTEQMLIIQDGVMVARVVDKDGNELATNSIIVGKIDNVGPRIIFKHDEMELDVDSGKLSMPVVISDYGSGLNKDTFSKNALIIKISGVDVPHDKLTLTFAKEETVGDNIIDYYNLDIDFSVTKNDKIYMDVINSQILDLAGNSTSELGYSEREHAISGRSQLCPSVMESYSGEWGFEQLSFYRDENNSWFTNTRTCNVVVEGTGKYLFERKYPKISNIPDGIIVFYRYVPVNGENGVPDDSYNHVYDKACTNSICKLNPLPVETIPTNISNTFYSCDISDEVTQLYSHYQYRSQVSAARDYPFRVNEGVTTVQLYAYDPSKAVIIDSNEIKERLFNQGQYQLDSKFSENLIDCGTVDITVTKKASKITCTDYEEWCDNVSGCSPYVASCYGGVISSRTIVGKDESGRNIYNVTCTGGTNYANSEATCTPKFIRYTDHITTSGSTSSSSTTSSDSSGSTSTSSSGTYIPSSTATTYDVPTSPGNGGDSSSFFTVVGH